MIEDMQFDCSKIENDLGLDIHMRILNQEFDKTVEWYVENLRLGLKN